MTEMEITLNHVSTSQLLEDRNEAIGYIESSQDELMDEDLTEGRILEIYRVMAYWNSIGVLIEQEVFFRSVSIVYMHAMCTGLGGHQYGKER